MKIVQVIPFFGMGGAEIMCENLVYELKRLGHEVVVVSLYNRETVITQRLQESSIDIRFLDKKQGFDFSMYRELRKLFKQEKPDVIHTHLYVTKYVFPMATQLKIKVVHTFHSIAQKENGRLARVLNKFFFKHCHVIPVALSELVRDTIIKEYNIDKDRIPVVFNGVALSRCILKDDYTITGNFKILHIGRFSAVKNHIGLVKAFHLFHDKHPDSELWLIGEGKMKEDIKQYIQENNLENDVRLLGLQENVYIYLSQVDIFTLPSNYEGMPMTIIEAMGTGLPIVATAVGGVPDMLDESSAQLVSVDEKEIAEAFEIYYNDYELRKRHGKNALMAAQRFSVKEMAKRYCDIYR